MVGQVSCAAEVPLPDTLERSSIASSSRVDGALLIVGSCQLGIELARERFQISVASSAVTPR